MQWGLTCWSTADSCLGGAVQIQGPRVTEESEQILKPRGSKFTSTYSITATAISYLLCLLSVSTCQQQMINIEHNEISLKQKIIPSTDLGKHLADMEPCVSNSPLSEIWNSTNFTSVVSKFMINMCKNNMYSINIQILRIPGHENYTSNSHFSMWFQKKKTC